MTEILIEFARDVELPAQFRRQCAMDVLEYARGKPKLWLHDGETIDPAAAGAAGLGATIGQEIDAAKQTARLHEQLARLTAQNIHPRDWPEDVRKVAMDMVAFYDEADNVIDAKPG